MDVKVEAEEVIRGLTYLEAMHGARRGMAAGGALILSKLATYPPQRPNSRYRRTGNLGRRWTMRQRGLTVTIGNNAEYAEEVQGEKQKHFHRETGWQTPEDVVNANGPAIINMIRAYVGQR